MIPLTGMKRGGGGGGGDYPSGSGKTSRRSSYGAVIPGG